MTSAKLNRRIVIFGNSAQSMNNFRGPLIRHFAENGYEVFAVAPGYNSDSEKITRELGAVPVSFNLDRAGFNPIRELVAGVRFYKLIKRLEPTALISYFVKPSIYGSFSGWLAKIPCRIALIEGLGYSFDRNSDSGLKRQALKFAVSFLFRWTLARATKILVLNEDDQETLIDLRIRASDHIENVGGIGVDLASFIQRPVPRDKAVFLLAARLIREKGIYEFVDAARIVKTHHPEIEFILLGGIDENPSGLQKETVQGWVDEGLITWPGNVPDVRPWMAKATVFVLPSYYREGVPRSIQEAMAIGRAIITTNNVGCRDTVDPGVNGIIVEPRQPEDLARAIMLLAFDYEKVVAMGNASRAIAEKRYDARIFNRRVLELITTGR